jgi:hypothetical protein
MIRCPGCGAQAAENSRYCSACASPLAVAITFATRTVAAAPSPAPAVSSVSPGAGELRRIGVVLPMVRGDDVAVHGANRLGIGAVGSPPAGQDCGAPVVLTKWI